MATLDDGRQADLGSPEEASAIGGETELSIAEKAEAARFLGYANDTLFRGPIDRIHSQKGPGLARLAVAELMHRLRGEGISLTDGARASCGAHESMEGAYYVRKGDDRLCYGVCDFRAYLNGAQAFSFQSDNPGKVSTNSDADDIRKVDKMLRALNGALSSTLAELDDALATAETTLDASEKEQVAAALLRLDDDSGLYFGLSNGGWYNDFEGQLEIDGDGIGRLDSMLEGDDTPPPPAIHGETQRFTACKAGILTKLSELEEALGKLEDTDLTGTALGSDGFVLLALVSLGSKLLPETART